MVRTGRIGLALAGGGPLGATWELGALVALQEALPELEFSALDGYVGVSAGSFIAAGLANGLSPRAMCDAFIEGDDSLGESVHPGLFVQPAWAEALRRLASLPARLAGAAYDLALGQRSVLAAAERLAAALPSGLFSSLPMQQQLQRLFSQPGRSDDFRQLKHPLVLVATDLDNGEAAPFGLPGWDAVPISLAVAASSALPGLFPPVRIGGHDYVDGALKKTLHARVLLDQGLDLLLCLNPLVPFDATQAHPRVLEGGPRRIPRIADGGLPLVLSQTFRTLIHSRLELGLKGYDTSHPGTDIVLFEPESRDPRMFGAHLFSYRQRGALAEHAYQTMRQDLRSRRLALGPVLARSGLKLDDAVLDDPRRVLLRRPGPLSLAGRRPRLRTALAQPLKRLQDTLDELEDRLRRSLQVPR